MRATVYYKDMVIPAYRTGAAEKLPMSFEKRVY